jgi:hypothetical protein
LADRIEVDYSELIDLIGDFKAARRNIKPEVRKVVSKGALNIKNGWRRRWSGHPTIKHLPQTIAYNIRDGADVVSAEIGPQRGRRQAPLAHLIEFGNTEYGTLANAPIPGGKPELDDEAPKFERALADLGERLLVERRATR